MRQKYDSILETVGNTPVVRINNLAPPHVTLYVKVESFNPLGSVKDRLALGVIEDAERSGAIKPGQTVVESTRDCPAQQNPPVAFLHTGAWHKGIARSKHSLAVVKTDLVGCH